jgi:hypothetical protein
MHFVIIFIFWNMGNQVLAFENMQGLYEFNKVWKHPRSIKVIIVDAKWQIACIMLF